MRTVCVACAVPNGLIIADGIVLNGPGKVADQERQSGAQTGLLVGGYALTRGVDAEEWEAWLEANAKSDAVRRGLIFAFESEAAVRHHALTRGAGVQAPDYGQRTARTGQMGRGAGRE